MAGMQQSIPRGPPDNPNGDIPVTQPPADSISDLAFSRVGGLLAASAWSKEVRCWQISQNGQTTVKGALLAHQAPVLCCDFDSHDPSLLYSGSCDKTGRVWNISTNESKAFIQHDAPIKHVFHVPELNAVISGSWDKTVRCWDIRSPTPLQGTIPVHERVYAMDVKGHLVIVCTANRRILCYDLSKSNAPFREQESPLKMQLRCVAAFLPHRDGFAVGSIEGRCGVQYFSDPPKSNKHFAFKCHRVQETQVYSVNSISFHPIYGTFATAGSDGSCVFWNKDTKKRLKQFVPANQSITIGKFSHDGSIYAYALSYDWSRGVNGWRREPNTVLLHAVQEFEMNPPPQMIGGRR